MIGSSGHQGLVGHAEHLTVGRHRAQQIRHCSAHASTDAGIDFIKKKGTRTIHSRKGCFQGQQKPRHLATRSHLSKRSQGLTWIRGKQKLNSVCPQLTRISGVDRHLKTHIGQPHRPQMIQQGLLQGPSRLLPQLTELAVHLIPSLTRLLFFGFQLIQGAQTTFITQLVAKVIPQLTQPRQVITMTTLQTFQQSEALLQLMQASWITVQARAVVL